MTQITSFRAPPETVEFDHDVLSAICDRYGAEAEDYITQRLTRVERLLNRVAVQLNAGGMRGLLIRAAEIEDIAREIGMVTLERAARSVVDAAQGGDRTALMPCAARLLRLGQPETIAHWTVRQDTVA